MNMRKALLFTAIVASVLLATSETQAQCTCAPDRVNITAEKEFTLAYAVFIGKVVDIKKSPRDENDDYVETVTFHVTKAWKHDLNANLTITNKIQFCLNGFDQGEEWLVYVYRHQDGKLGSFCCCTRTTLLERAATDLKTFREYRPAKVLRPTDAKP
jgi:hypothetical protein